MGIFDFLKNTSSTSQLPILLTDVHSHLLPGIDDGARDLNESMSMIEEFYEMGYRKLITTPHIMQDYYPNTPELIRQKLDETRGELVKRKIDITLEAAAEYYLDEFFLDKLKNKQELMTFHDNHLLFEMSFMSESPFLKEAVFLLRSSGKIPVLAHVERYSYYFKNFQDIEDLLERGCFLQININSLGGYYGKPSQLLAQRLIDKEMVHLLGSDCHNSQHLEIIRKVRQSKYFTKAVNLALINHSIEP